MCLALDVADTAEASSGTSDLSIALVGLGGVLVGAVIGLVGIWLQSRNERRMARRTELLTLVSEYAAFMESAYQSHLEFVSWDEQFTNLVDQGEKPSKRIARRWDESHKAKLKAFNDWSTLRYKIAILGSPAIRDVTQAWNEELPLEDHLTLSHAFMLIARRDTALTLGEHLKAWYAARTELRSERVRTLLE